MNGEEHGNRPPGYRLLIHLWQIWQSWEKKRQVTVVIFVGLLMATAFSTYVIGNYLHTRRPLPAVLPGVSSLAAAIPPHYAGSILGVANPTSVAVNTDGDRLYVTEEGGERLVKVFDSSGKLLQRLAPPSTSVGLRKPAYVAVDKSGRVYVSDRVRIAVQMYDRNGAWIGVYSPSEAQMGWSPLGVNAQPNGFLTVTDVQAEPNRILTFASNEILKQKILVGPGQSELAFPSAAVQDKEGRTYVSDSNNSRVIVYDANGKAISEVVADEPNGGVAMPRGLALDDQNRLYVVDSQNHDVKVFQAGDQLKYLFTFGSEGIEDGQFRFPNGIAIDTEGRIWVTDTDNNRVQLWIY